MKNNLSIMDQKLIPNIGVDVIARIIMQAFYSELSTLCPDL